MLESSYLPKPKEVVKVGLYTLKSFKQFHYLLISVRIQIFWFMIKSSRGAFIWYQLAMMYRTQTNFLDNSARVNQSFLSVSQKPLPPPPIKVLIICNYSYLPYSLHYLLELPKVQNVSYLFVYSQNLVQCMALSKCLHVSMELLNAKTSWLSS